MEAEEWFIVRQEEAENLRKKEVLGEFDDSTYVNVMIKHRNCYYHKGTIQSNESRVSRGHFIGDIKMEGLGLLDGVGGVVVAHGQRSCPKLRYNKTYLLRSLLWAATYFIRPPHEIYPFSVEKLVALQNSFYCILNRNLHILRIFCLFHSCYGAGVGRV